MEPKVIFEDSEILVLDKPAGMTVNRAETTKGERTVQDWVDENVVAARGPVAGFPPASARSRVVASATNSLRAVGNPSTRTTPRFSENFVALQRDFINRSGIVHRIDKETSGLLLVAKTPDAFLDLQRQFKERKVKKTYIALVHGEVKPSEGEIRVPVGRLPWNRKRFGVIAGGREAVTKYKILRYEDTKILGGLTLVELYPETGRTHQIRVHLKYAGHPIFGDSQYAGRKISRADRKMLSRLFLHAAKITFSHPKTKSDLAKTGERITFESPIPEELRTALRSGTKIF